MLHGKNILLAITGGIAAYKTPDLVRGLKRLGADVTCVLSPGGAKFVSELALQSVSGNRVYTDLFSLTDEHEMGHIRLARDADLVLVAPATASTIGKIAQGMAGDLIGTILLATTAPVMLAPAMNWAMWENKATVDNVKTITGRGIKIIGPVAGELACGEEGIGRMADIEQIIKAVNDAVAAYGPLKGLSAIVTSGPTHEPIDPVRYIANRSSGKQGHAIAGALQNLGADVTLISGPVNIAPPKGVKIINVITANEMLAAVNSSLPVDIFIAAAAVADWRTKDSNEQKIKKQDGINAQTLGLIQNPDILKTVATTPAKRPRLVIGFSAETENLVENARRKLAAKGCDWILANDVSVASGTFGGEENQISLIKRSGIDEWPRMGKHAVAKKLAELVVENFADDGSLQISRDVS
ncbi:MAG: bifunctional phosphopantothenoylcysteine decarboxylase/phosphopantothenate--cysteine ligase CoaBC [Rhodospirillaceae bacterium]|nr:bifunctional phosphopantothenoylcysteine decarboxylase/phosphopantothenate--cysteine ligase CoaBC [Rhodospirillaceae bacterium]